MLEGARVPGPGRFWLSSVLKLLKPTVKLNVTCNLAKQTRRVNYWITFTSGTHVSRNAVFQLQRVHPSPLRLYLKFKPGFTDSTTHSLVMQDMPG